MACDSSNENTLLICTIGSSPQPVALALKHIRPDRVIFVCSAETAPDLSGPRPQLKNPPRTGQDGTKEPDRIEVQIGAACTENVIVTDHQTIKKCIRSIRENVEPEIRKWRSRSADHKVAVDFTGGTKPMSAALALCARQWTCKFWYTGGTQRDKAGIGVVQDGSEQAFQSENPWNALGYQAIEEYCLFFNCGQFEAARSAAGETKKRIDEQAVKEQFNALEALAEAYAKWEVFDHNSALDRLKTVIGKYGNGLAACGPEFSAPDFRNTLQANLEDLELLKSHAGQPGAALVGDLLANAGRRGAEGRFDDAVARLYRCTEAIAQFRLKVQYQLDSGAVPLEKIPANLRNKWVNRGENGSLKLGLQDDYALLHERQDNLGRKFVELGMAGDKSALAARNDSILAHGFVPISRKAYQALLGNVEALAKELGENMVRKITFPKIGQ